ncbi:TetR/AcrR family transcriptional regulator [Bacillus marasmi]|uniref:TetR/AcrR family transcriptional regulator n=1 Tax=Bacillus marasmi TaxID=1926279 RepID=UPI0011C94775|nr:TetR/AcrR family transcriptional regulator [Bacillus marasmi]
MWSFIKKEVTTIYTAFYKLKEVKQELIINSAIKEFVKSGFDKASTNEIVKEANISKGSLFAYFQSKKGLYIFLIEYGSQIIGSLYEHIDLNETDLFKRLENIGIQKLHIHKRYPLVFDFLASTVQEESIEVKDIIKDKVDSIYAGGKDIIYKNIDYTKFREGIDIEKAIEILNWTMFGFGEKAIHQINSFENIGEFGDQYLKEWERYSEILKYSFYK